METKTSSAEKAPATRGVAAWRPPELGHMPAADAIGAGTSISLNEAALQEAHRAGWLEGHAEAMTQRAVAAEDSASASQIAAQALADIADRLGKQVATTVHALSVAIARHLVEREMTQDATLLHDLVKRALALTPMNGQVTVRMNPVDLTALNAVGGLQDMPDTGIEIRWLADRDVSRGGCLVDGPHGIVDGRIDRALLDIYEQLSHD